MLMVRTMSSTTAAVGASSHTSSRYRLAPYRALLHTTMEWIPSSDTSTTTPRLRDSIRTCVLYSIDSPVSSIVEVIHMYQCIVHVGSVYCIPHYCMHYYTLQCCIASNT